MSLGRPTFAGVARAVYVAAAGWILAGTAVVALVHVDDRYRIDHVSGAWTALARYVGSGTLYPPLYDGERFGGTRFMPLQMLLHAGLGEATGNYLVAGKLLALALGVALLALMLVALRRVGAPVWLGLGLLAVLVTTFTGLTAVTSIRGDTLPVVLQLAAILVFGRWAGRGGAIVAGLLCAAALLAKISALWAAAAIVACLLLGDRRRLPTFLAAYVPATGVALVVLELVTAGRFTDNVFGLATSALADVGDIANALTTKPLTLVDSDTAAISIVLPLALAELVLAAKARVLALEHFAFAAAVLVTLALMADIGVVSNHLLDLEVLTLLLAGRLWGRRSAREQALAVLVPAAVLWAAVSAYAVDLHPDVRTAILSAVGRTSVAYPLEPPRELVPPGARLLSEDPTLDVVRGRHPTVLDPFMLVRIVERHPEWGDDLVRRLDEREFDRVVLRADHVLSDGTIEVENPRWRREHFGREIVAAIARNYDFRAFADPYAVYVPASG
jgi:hypothetical protein